MSTATTCTRSRRLRSGCPRRSGRNALQLPRLAQAGVVDAGGAGYVLLLESLERVVTGDIGAESFNQKLFAWLGTRCAVGPGGPRPVARQRGLTSSPAVPHTRSCTCCPRPPTRPSRSSSSGWTFGSACSSSSSRTWRACASTTNRHRARHRPPGGRTGSRSQRPDGHPAGRGQAVVTCAREGLAGAFQAAGAWVVPSGLTPSNAGRSLGQVDGGRSGDPAANDGGAAGARRGQGGCRGGVDLRVVHARTAVQGIAALAVYDPDRPFGDNVLEMSSAAAATRTAA